MLIGATRALPDQPVRKRNAGDKLKLRPVDMLYLAGEDLDLAYTRQEVRQVIAWYNEGVPGPVMAERMDRREIEVFVLLDDLIRHMRVKERKGGWHGGTVKT